MPKSRKVVVTMELWTDIKLAVIKDERNWELQHSSGYADIEQIQANVIKDDD